MDSESCVCATKKTNDATLQSCQVLPFSLENSAEQSLEPITPDAAKENGDFPVDLSPPISVAKRVPKILNFDVDGGKERDLFDFSDGCISPRTPKDGVFDPFAPGPDDMVLAPLCRKYYNEARASVARRLDFGSHFKEKGYSGYGVDSELCTDEEMFQSVYENLLEAILSNQAEDALAEISKSEWDFDDCQTPPSAPRLYGIAETCPGAPRKAKDKAWSITGNKDLELLPRKLEL